MNEFVNWIESHPTMMDLIKWCGILLFAWLSGFVRFIRNYTKRPSISIISTVSRCYVEKMDEFEGCKNVVRAAFLVDVTVRNPTRERIVVESFSLSYIKNKPFYSQALKFHPVTMPNRPRLKMGSGTKLSTVFFSNFDDGLETLTMSGDIKEKQFQTGYLLFVSFTWGSWNPKITKEHIRAKISCQLTTGNVISDSTLIKVTTDVEMFEKWVPGIIDQIGHECTWNAVNQ